MAPLLENEKDKGLLRFDDKDKANILQKQFSSVFTHETDDKVPSIPDRTDSFILDVNITEDTAIKKLKNLNTNKSCGPGGIHAQLLLELADLIALPIQYYSIRQCNLAYYLVIGNRQLYLRFTRKDQELML